MSKKGHWGIRKSVRTIWNTVPSCVCWVIWKERNVRCFEEKTEAAQARKDEVCILDLIDTTGVGSYMGKPFSFYLYKKVSIFVIPDTH